MKKLTALIPLLAASAARAAEPVSENGFSAIFGPGDFFAAIVAGVILTIVFQSVLTMTSVAAGITFVGRSKDDNAPEADGHQPRIGQKIRTIGSGVGGWAAGTSCLSFFFACLLAVNLIPIPRLGIAITTSLVIWAISSAIFMTLEMGAVMSIAGAIFRSASAGLRGAFEAVTSAFSPSPEQRAAQNAERIAGAIGDQLRKEARGRRLSDEVRTFLSDIAPQRLEPGRVQQELRRMFSDEEMDAISSGHFDDAVAKLREKSGLTDEKARQYANSVKDAFARIRQQAGQAKAAASSKSSDMVNQALAKLEQYMDSLGRPELSYEAVRGEFEHALKDPKAGGRELLERLKRVDRNTIKAILSSRRNTSPEEAEQMISRVETMREKAAGSAKTVWNSAERRLQEVKYSALDVAEETRKTAATMAWWAVAIAGLSAVASVVGGVVATRIGV